jgi:hypothetical protein
LRRFRGTSAVIATSLLVGCGGGASDAPPSPAPPAGEVESELPPLPTREEFVTSGLRYSEVTRAGLADTLGPPDSISAEVVPNRHIPTATDSILTLHYPELTARIHVPGPGGELPAAVEVADNVHLSYPMIGTTTAAVVEAFGPPDERSDTSLTYLCTSCVAGDDPVRLFTEDGRVTRVGFEFYVD